MAALTCMCIYNQSSNNNKIFFASWESSKANQEIFSSEVFFFCMESHWSECKSETNFKQKYHLHVFSKHIQHDCTHRCTLYTSSAQASEAACVVCLFLVIILLYLDAALFTIQLSEQCQQTVLPPPSRVQCYPVVYHHNIVYLSSSDARQQFTIDPDRYLLQEIPGLPVSIKLAVLGPPKSGKSTGIHTSCGVTLGTKVSFYTIS